MGVDTILVGAELVTTIQSIFAPKLDPAQHTVVLVTGFNANGWRNILLGNATLKGDARALTTQTNAAIKVYMRQIEDCIAATHAARSSAGLSKMNADCDSKLFSEDFSHTSNAAPSFFMQIGKGISGANARPLHATDYDFNDETLVLGASYIATLIKETLANNHTK